jgi:hypothetical protein
MALPSLGGLPVQTGYQPPNSDDILKHRHAETARKLAYWLVAILAGSFLFEWSALSLFNLDEPHRTALEHFFNAWLPVIAGLASSAATYYFTKEGK